MKQAVSVIYSFLTILSSCAVPTCVILPAELALLQGILPARAPLRFSQHTSTAEGCHKLPAKTLAKVS